MPEAYYQLGKILAGSAETLQEATSAWKAAVELRPTFAEAHTLLAMKLAHSSSATDRKLARASAAAAVELGPEHAMTHVVQAQAIAGPNPSRLKPEVGAWRAYHMGDSFRVRESPLPPPCCVLTTVRHLPRAGSRESSCCIATQSDARGPSSG